MSENLASVMQKLGVTARDAATILAKANSQQKNDALAAASAALHDNRAAILEANALDIQAANDQGLQDAKLDRLRLDPQRIEAMINGLNEIRKLADPVGQVISQWDRPNGLRIQRVRVPLGVIGIIYESRPNVTADAGALCMKAGNAVILRGGSEGFHSNRMIHACMVSALQAAGLPAGAIQMVPTTDRAAVGYLLRDMSSYIDVIVPRGGKSLIARVQRDARIPVIGHLEGLCHVYIDGAADLEMAIAITLNAKLRRTGICGAAETLLVDAVCADSHLVPIVNALLDAGCEVRGDEAAQRVDRRIKPATEEDWSTEYLAPIISVKLVNGVDGAIQHITRYGSSHTESIVTNDAAAAEKFLNEIDSAILLHNASTQFADGGQFGMGAEIGIATGKLHARGPVGVEQLTSYKYLVRGNGQIRP